MSHLKTLLDHFLPVRLLLITCLLITAWGCRQDVSEQAPIKIYAGAGLRPALAELTEQFREQTGLTCEVDYGGSGLILSRAKADDQADLFIPGDVWYVDRLDELTSNVQQKTTISYFVPTIIVQKGNPKQIKVFFSHTLRPVIEEITCLAVIKKIEFEPVQAQNHVL